jgi:hypothetical protein
LAQSGTKLITSEMVDQLTVQQLYALRKQGWKYPPEVYDGDWRKDPSYAKYGVQQPDTSGVDQYVVGSVPDQPEPADVKQVENDPKLQQIAGQMGTTVRGLLQLREMMLDRHAHDFDHLDDAEE